VRHAKADVCVIGSGPGGAVIAHEAARRGLSVLVLERGPRVEARDTSDREAAMIPRLYKDGGLQMTSSLDMFILQGSCVGGSSVLANMVMLRPPRRVFDRWAAEGAELELDRLDRSFDAVERALGVRIADEALMARGATLFVEGARALGLDARPAPKATGDCRGCGNCNNGCAFGAKRSMLTTYLPWAEALGARVLADTTVRRVVCRRGRAVGVEAERDGEPLHVHADTVVVAAGAIGSSALLLASRLGENVGTRLGFNTGAILAGEFDEVVDGFDGDPLTAYLQTSEHLLEALHAPPLARALTTAGWREAHGALMRRHRHLAYAGALTPTAPSGRVTRSWLSGGEEARYRASPAELSRLVDGLRLAGKILFAAGATRVVLPMHAFSAARSVRDLDALAGVRSTRELVFGSSHPQGGNPMSSDARRGVVDARFAVHGVQHLYVCDASVFPSPIGVNPMTTILALAHYAAAGIFGSTSSEAS
jgi:choline dehydrogenase-like flavoprotein